MNAQGVERVAKFVSHTGRQQCQCLDTLALNRLVGLFASLGGVMQNQRHSGAALCVAVERRSVKPDESFPGVVQLELPPHHTPAAFVIRRLQGGPVKFGKQPRHRLIHRRILLKTGQSGRRGVEISNVPVRVGDHYAVLDRVEQRFQKRPIPDKPLNKRLQVFRVEGIDAPENLFNETGLGRGHAA